MSSQVARWSERAIFRGGLILGIVLRIIQIATSIGSSDALWWTKHVSVVEHLGVFRAYTYSPLVNHPPLALEIAKLTARFGALIGITFPDAFRGLQGIADVVTFFALARMARFSGESRTWVSVVFFLSPATIFISAFHCNSDPLMTMLVVVAMLAVAERYPLLGGIAIGAATGIKIIALAALPVLFLGCRGVRERVRFTLAAAVTGALIFLPAMIVTGPVVFRNIFGYIGTASGWGLPLLGRIIEVAIPHLFPVDPSRLVAPLLVAAIFCVWGAEAWRTRSTGAIEPERLPRVLALVYLIVLFLGSGFLPHYFFWFLPYLAFLFRRRTTILLHAVASFFLFLVYTSWSGGWPWRYAGGRNPPIVGIIGLFVWAALGAAVVTGARTLYRRRAAP
jgi:hypothetical protein